MFPLSFYMGEGDKDRSETALWHTGQNDEFNERGPICLTRRPVACRAGDDYRSSGTTDSQSVAFRRGFRPSSSFSPDRVRAAKCGFTATPTPPLSARRRMLSWWRRRARTIVISGGRVVTFDPPPLLPRLPRGPDIIYVRTSCVFGVRACRRSDPENVA